MRFELEHRLQQAVDILMHSRPISRGSLALSDMVEKREVRPPTAAVASSCPLRSFRRLRAAGCCTPRNRNTSPLCDHVSTLQAAKAEELVFQAHGFQMYGDGDLSLLEEADEAERCALRESARPSPFQFFGPHKLLIANRTD